MIDLNRALETWTTAVIPRRHTSQSRMLITKRWPWYPGVSPYTLSCRQVWGWTLFSVPHNPEGPDTACVMQQPPTCWKIHCVPWRTVFSRTMLQFVVYSNHIERPHPSQKGCAWSLPEGSLMPQKPTNRSRCPSLPMQYISKALQQ